MKLPDGAVMICNVLIVQYMDTDGYIYTDSEAYDNAGVDLDPEKVCYLVEVAKGKAMAPSLAQQVAAFCMADSDE